MPARRDGDGESVVMAYSTVSRLVAASDGFRHFLCLSSSADLGLVLGLRLLQPLLARVSQRLLPLLRPRPPSCARLGVLLGLLGLAGRALLGGLSAARLSSAACFWASGRPRPAACLPRPCASRRRRRPSAPLRRCCSSARISALVSLAATGAGARSLDHRRLQRRGASRPAPARGSRPPAPAAAARCPDRARHRRGHVDRRASSRPGAVCGAGAGSWPVVRLRHAAGSPGSAAIRYTRRGSGGSSTARRGYGSTSERQAFGDTPVESALEDLRRDHHHQLGLVLLRAPCSGTACRGSGCRRCPGSSASC